MSRLNRLKPAQQLCLKVASVIGRTFRERMVREAHPVETQRDAVGDHLAALAALDLASHGDTGTGPCPTCSSTSSRATSRMNPCRSPQRQPLHRAVAA